MDKPDDGTARVAQAANTANTQRPAERPYGGMPGHTRYESVHLVEPDGSMRALAMCRAVNVKTHPELKEQALSGQLHRLDDGRELALPFVYHDPEARQFALVIPLVLAHLELKEWSKLMAEIAQDTAHDVPAYVRDSATVIGVGALARFVNAASEPQAPRADQTPRMPIGTGAHQLGEHLQAQREAELLEQERSLIRMAEGLTAREGELNRLREQLDTARIDLEIRETELSDQRSRVVSGGGWQERLAGAAHTDATVVADFSRELAATSDSFNQDSSSLDDRTTMSPPSSHRSLPPPLRPRTRSGPPPLPYRPIVGRGTPPPLGARRDHEELTVVARPTEPPPLPGAALQVAGDARIEEDQPEITPPPYFVNQGPGQMALKLAGDELWLFVHLEETHAAAFRHNADLMLQYAQADGHPVAVLSLVDQSGDEPYAIRLALDGRAELDLRVLEHLSRSFRARVALYVRGVYFETVTVSTLRESVAQAICDKIDKLPNERGAHTSAEAVVRVLHSPPPLWNDDLPFGPSRRETPSTAAVHAAVEQLAAWLRPEKLAEATLTYSVPRNVIDATSQRVLRAAVVFGIALPERLVKLAVEHGVATDLKVLLRDQMQAFRQRVEQNENDLGDEGTRLNWEQLFRQAETHDVPVDDRVKRLAEADQRDVEALESSSSRPLAGLSASDLKAQLDDPAQRMDAIRELCVRGHPSAIEPIVDVLPVLEPAELAASAAQLLGFGEAVGDALIEMLSASSPQLRQVAALGLGKLKLRRALVPLIKQLETEDAGTWQEMARAFGDFGLSALRPVVRAGMGNAEAERSVFALAHLANHGGAKEVEKLENDPDPEVSQLARKAMARRSRMEWEDLAVREQRTLTDSSPAARLSQAFFAEASKVDI